MHPEDMSLTPEIASYVQLKLIVVCLGSKKRNWPKKLNLSPTSDSPPRKESPRRESPRGEESPHEPPARKSLLKRSKTSSIEGREDLINEDKKGHFLKRKHSASLKKSELAGLVCWYPQSSHPRLLPRLHFPPPRTFPSAKQGWPSMSSLSF